VSVPADRLASRLAFTEAYQHVLYLLPAENNPVPNHEAFDAAIRNVHLQLDFLAAAYVEQSPPAGL